MNGEAVTSSIHRVYRRKLCGKRAVALKNLPPTEDAAFQHTLRIYLQASHTNFYSSRASIYRHVYILCSRARQWNRIHIYLIDNITEKCTLVTSNKKGMYIIRYKSGRVTHLIQKTMAGKASMDLYILFKGTK